MEPEFTEQELNSLINGMRDCANVINNEVQLDPSERGLDSIRRQISHINEMFTREQIANYEGDLSDIQSAVQAGDEYLTLHS